VVSFIYRVRGRDIIPQRLVALGMVLILTAFLPISLAAASLVTVYQQLHPQLYPPTQSAIPRPAADVVHTPDRGEPLLRTETGMVLSLQPARHPYQWLIRF
jgi:hypothetical protein